MTKKKQTFEQSMERLEEIVEKLEQEEVSLDEAVAFYKEGLTLSAFCKEKLAVAEGEILLLRKEAGLWQEESFETEEQEQ
ncbi:MAG: exodeoxyribonuclease VII small subunit [Clostridia bacterium]|nr:exodeoxyribonuclease VII small subunit [Anaerotignum sp.]NCC15402.1 exodeoxyribonuclease VII small subunit [Clostridia bacterium]